MTDNTQGFFSKPDLGGVDPDEFKRKLQEYLDNNKPEKSDELAKKKEAEPTPGVEVAIQALKSESIKYFTPDIEDIRIGYECESFDGTEWRCVTLKDYVQKGWILRTPYLTKEQIEKEGWKDVTPSLNSSIWKFEKSKIQLKYNFINKTLRIYEVDMIAHDCNIEPDIVITNKYSGECKDINTLRYICKLLKINE